MNPSWVFLAIVIILVLVLALFGKRETYQPFKGPAPDQSYVYNTYTGKYEKSKF
jgi:hypothetical protein